MIFISLYDILNSIDRGLEKNIKNYNNSFIDNFIDELRSKLDKANSIDKTDDFLFTLDRYEGDFAVCENRESREMINISRNKISNLAKEGDVIRLKNGMYVVDNSTDIENIEKKVEKLWKD